MEAAGNERYARQIVLPGVGAEGQRRLQSAKALIVGCGGLGHPVAAYLAGAGVGQLTLVDGDRPDITNMHRQVFFKSGEVRPKSTALAEHCTSLNPRTCVLAKNTFLDRSNVKGLVSDADIVLDCTDDAASKHLLSDACHHLRTPLVYAAAQGFEGYVALFGNGGGEAVHLRDLYPEADPTLPDCATTGVLGTAVGTIGMLQANAALCFLLRIGSPPVDTLLTYNALDNRQHRLRIRKTFRGPPPLPWSATEDRRATLETDDFDLARYDGVFTMLDDLREPAPPAGVVRLSKRNPYGQCVERMTKEGHYLIYCNSGKLSLMLAAQLRKAGYDALSLAGGLVRYGL